MTGGERMHRFKERRDDERGVASVIGVIFALMIFMTLLTLVVTAFVPSWEKGNEQEFMSVALSQMGQVKGAGLELMDASPGSSRYIPFDVAPSSVPLFGRTYVGELEYKTGGAGVSTMTVSFNDVEHEFSGSLTYRILNAHNPYEVVYQHGAVLLVDTKDGRNGIIKSAPGISWEHRDGGVALNITHVDLLGGNQADRSSGTVGLTVSMSDANRPPSYSVSGPVTITWVSQDAQAWNRWAVDTFGDGAVSHVEGSSTVTVTLNSVNTVNYISLKVQMMLEG